MTAPIFNNLGMGGGNRRVLLKDGDVVIQGGAVVIIPAGKDPEECECCDCAGCTTGTTCTYCSGDITPDTYRILISDVTMCTACIDNEGAGGAEDVSVAWKAGDVINATHDLAQTAGCTWEKTLANALTITTHTSTDATCVGVSATVDVDIDIQLTKNGVDGWRMLISATTGAMASGGVGIFYDTVADPDNLCCSLPQMDNEDGVVGDCLSVSPILGYVQYFYDGTITGSCI